MRTFYINLASRPDRRSAMEVQFEQLGLAPTRIEATTPAGISPQEKAAYCNPRRFRWLTEVELACSKSHVAALEIIIAGEDPFGLIFEDDVVLSARLPAFLAAFDRSPPPVDVLRIEADPNPLRIDPAEPATIGGIALRTVHSWSSGAAGYIVSLRAARRIVATGAMLRMQTDRVLFNPYEATIRGKLTLRHTDPALCIQLDRLPRQKSGVAASDIGRARSQREVVERALFPRRLLPDLHEVYTRDVRMGLQKAWRQYLRGARKRVIPFAPD